MEKPKLKDIHGVLFLKDKIRVGSGLDYAIEIDNPEDKYTELIKNLKKDYDLATIVAKSKSEKLSSKEITEAIFTLTEAGYIEDSNIVPPDSLSEEELERYKVNLNFFNTLATETTSKFDFQNKLKESHILIFGMGGIGSNICLALLELGIGTITAVDFDIVELSNLNRQILYSTSSIGNLKISEAKKRAEEFNPNVKFNAIHQQISSTDDVSDIIKESNCDMVVNVADYPTGFIDFWVNEACMSQGKPLIAALVQKKYGRVYSVVPNETTCYNCQYLNELIEIPSYKEELESTRLQSDPNGLDLFRTPNGALGPTCLFQGYFVSYEILRYILFGKEEMLTFNKRFSINFLTFESEFEKLEKNNECKCCK